RATARKHLANYLVLPNYSNNWLRLDFTEDDLADGGSDRLVDALVVWGDEQAIADRVQAHRDAGADHVCIQVLTDDPSDTGLEQLRRLAPALTAG
ncbi:LLM class F420-dependent oxidoreductase, partial [cyanobacterium TDX16]